MKQLLHSPSMFGKIDLVIQSRFRSSYGLALYENCIRYRGLPHTKWFEMDLFKKLMGVPPGKYEIFRDFKKRVLDKAVDEVNTYSDLIITAEISREGRKVVKVRFTLKERAKKLRLGNKNATLSLESKAVHPNLKSKLQDVFGFSEEQTEDFLRTYDNQIIQEKISMIEASKSFVEGKILNLSAYLLSAMKHDYQPPKVTSRPLKKRKEQESAEVAHLKRQVEAIRHAYTDYRDQGIELAIQALEESTQRQFIQDFFHYAQSTIQTVLHVQGNKYSQENIMKAPSVKAALRQFALRELDWLGLYSLEEYVARLDDAKREAWQKLKSYDPDHMLIKFIE
jgi:hypothetical protein